MRDALKARFLSSRWRYLSPTPFNLEFSKDLANSWNDKSIFLAQVDQILQQCEKTIPKVDSFKLHYFLANKDACHIDRWITFVVMMKTEKLDLDFSPPLENVKSYIFPCHLLREMPYLKHLCLAVCDLRYSPECTTTSSLNSLKHIDLQLVDLDQSALDTILSGCMNLEFLRLKRCMLPRELSIHGPFRCLKLLALFDCYGAYKFEILSVDRVVEFEYFGWSTNLNFVGVSAFKKAHIACRTYKHMQFGKGLPLLESLSLVLYICQVCKMQKYIILPKFISL